MKNNKLFDNHLKFILSFVVIVNLFQCKEKISIEPLEKPKVITGEILNITSNFATVNLEIFDDGNAPISENGIVISKSANPSINDLKIVTGKGIGKFTADISNLEIASNYNVRAFATNSVGTSYGDNKTFTTLSTLPSIKTIKISDVTFESATSGGEIISDGGSPIIDKGICFSIKSNPTVSDLKLSKGSGKESFITQINSLDINKQYYIRAYAINSIGVSYGENLSFTTLSFKQGLGMYDLDKNFYKTIIINGKEWMSENLRTSYVNDGKLISVAWANLSENWGLSCIGSKTMSEPLVFFRNKIDAEKFGHLYSWDAAQSVCPSGWRLPSPQDFDDLVNFMGGYAVAGSKLKDTTKGIWSSNLNQGTNSSGFSARPAGILARVSQVGDIKIVNEGVTAHFWTNSLQSYQSYCAGIQATYFELSSNNFVVNSPTFFGCSCTRTFGRSVRCIKN